ncbi:MAG: hypothetical protein KAX50_04875 [Saprospiraceae bacterium]|nr:hypothetical protein [Saprospiraceae bacterium]
MNPKSARFNRKSEIRNQPVPARNQKSLLPARAFLAAFAILELFAALFLSALFFQTNGTTDAIADAGFLLLRMIVIGLHESFILGAR